MKKRKRKEYDSTNNGSLTANEQLFNIDKESINQDKPKNIYTSEQLDVLEPIIKCYGVNHQYEENQQTLLHIKVSNGDFLSVQYLLEKSADPNLQNAQGQTPLHLATNIGDLEITKLLLAQGADPRLMDKKGKTPLNNASDDADYTDDWTIYQLIAEVESRSGEQIDSHPIDYSGDISGDSKDSSNIAGEQVKVITWEDIV